MRKAATESIKKFESTRNTTTAFLSAGRNTSTSRNNRACPACKSHWNAEATIELEKYSFKPKIDLVMMTLPKDE